VRKAEQPAQHRKQFQRDREMPGSSGAVVDKCVFNIFELAERLIQDFGNLTA
jgi:hypothetical protein